MSCWLPKLERIFIRLVMVVCLPTHSWVSEKQFRCWSCNVETSSSRVQTIEIIAWTKDILGVVVRWFSILRLISQWDDIWGASGIDYQFRRNAVYESLKGALNFKHFLPPPLYCFSRVIHIRCTHNSNLNTLTSDDNDNNTRRAHFERDFQIIW